MIYGFNASEVFQIGIEIEDNGRIFYERVQGLVDDPAVREIFSGLALAEVEHKQRFTAWKAQLPPAAQEKTVWDPDNETEQYLKMMADMHVFKAADSVEETLKNVRSSQDALRLAMQFEKDSIVFFLTMQDATEEKKGKERINQLVEEEKQHLKLLSLELRKIMFR